MSYTPCSREHRSTHPYSAFVGREMVHALGRVKSHGQACLLQIEPAHQGGWANALQIDLQSAAGSESCFIELQSTS